MDEEVKRYFEKLKSNPDVLGLILFGSYARGDNRSDSDVDLIVITKKGAERRIDTKDGKTYEMIWVSEEKALEHWKKDKDGCYGVWSDAKIIFDKTGSVRNLKTAAKKIIANGKRKLTELEYNHKKYDAEDQIRAIIRLSVSDKPAANYSLQVVVLKLAEQYLDINRIWSPPPKKMLQKIRDVNPGLGKLFNQFYEANLTLQKRIELAGQIINTVYSSNKKTIS